MTHRPAIIDWSPIFQYMAAAQAAREEFANSYLESLDALADLRAHLEAWEQELAKEQAQLKKERAQIEERGPKAMDSFDSLEIGSFQERLAAAEQESADARSEIQDYQDLTSDLRQQCESLENELERVRAHTAELSSSLTEERHKMDQARSKWEKEIQQMRHAMEQQNNQSILKPYYSASLSNPSSSNVVVGSVLAQFDKIRQQRVSRRTKDQP